MSIAVYNLTKKTAYPPPLRRHRGFARGYNLRMRILTLLSLAALLLMASCPGSTFQPLPTGSGQGDYTGVFTNEADTETLGELSFEVDENGVVDGDGILLGRDVSISGLFDGTQLEGFIDDDLYHLSGEFDGQRAGNGFSGSFELNQPAGEDPLVGFWDAAPATD